MVLLQLVRSFLYLTYYVLDYYDVRIRKYGTEIKIVKRFSRLDFHLRCRGGPTSFLRQRDNAPTVIGERGEREETYFFVQQNFVTIQSLFIHKNVNIFINTFTV